MNKNINLLKAMKNRVTRHVKSFKSDFNQDIETVKELDNGIEFIWVARESGTLLVPLSIDTIVNNYELAKTILTYYKEDTFKSNYYYCRKNGVDDQGVIRGDILLINPIYAIDLLVKKYENYLNFQEYSKL